MNPDVLSQAAYIVVLAFEVLWTLYKPLNSVKKSSSLSVFQIAYTALGYFAVGGPAGPWVYSGMLSVLFVGSALSLKREEIKAACLAGVPSTTADVSTPVPTPKISIFDKIKTYVFGPQDKMDTLTFLLNANESQKDTEWLKALADLHELLNICKEHPVTIACKGDPWCGCISGTCATEDLYHVVAWAYAHDLYIVA